MTLWQIERIHNKKKQLEPLGVTLATATSLSFLGGKDHLSQEEVMESQTNIEVQIHVERTIQ